MDNKYFLTKALAAAGTVLVWMPIFLTILTSIIVAVSRHIFRFDYLMPAELFPVALCGALLLFWAALRAHSHRGLIGWGLAAAVVFLAGGQAIAVVTGLASGAVPAAGWRLALVVASLAIYALALIEIGIAGIMLVKHLFSHNPITPQ